MLCSKLHCQKGFKFELSFYKIWPLLVYVFQGRSTAGLQEALGLPHPPQGACCFTLNLSLCVSVSLFLSLSDQVMAARVTQSSMVYHTALRLIDLCITLHHPCDALVHGVGG